MVTPTPTLRLVAAVGLVLLASCDRTPTSVGRNEPERLPIGRDWNLVDARISPDGSTLALIGIDETHSFRLGLLSVSSPGSVVDVTPGGAPVRAAAWLPDSRSLVVASGPAAGPVGMRIVDAGGAVLREIPLQARFRVETGGLAVSPDGHTVIASTSSLGELAEPQRLTAVDLRTGTATLAYEGDGEEGFSSLHFGPSGDVFLTRGHLNTSGPPDAYGSSVNLAASSSTRLTREGRVVTGIAPFEGGEYAYTWFAGDRFGAGLSLGSYVGDQLLYEGPDLRSPSVHGRTVYFLAGVGSVVSYVQTR
jgi:hypothetical protein